LPKASFLLQKTQKKRHFRQQVSLALEKSMTNPRMTFSDIAWTILFMVLFLPSIFIGMFGFAAYLTPAIIGSCNSISIHGFDSAVEIVLLFMGLGLGMFFAAAVFCALTRKFLSEDSHQRWAEQFENGQVNFSTPQRIIGRYFIRLTKPRKNL
jgi:hypothetical protein